MNFHRFDRIQVHYLQIFSLSLFPITGCGTSKMTFSSLYILAFQAVALETLNSFVVFHKDQVSCVRFKICIFSLLYDTLSFSFINSTI